MRRVPHVPWIAFAAAALLGTAAVTSCTPDASDPTAPTVSGVTAAAKGGNGKGGGGGDGDATSSDPSVNAADPASIPKGSVNVDLQISGSGFTAGSEVAFQLNGKRTRAIRTNSVTFVDETTLTANVDVEDDALEDFYDIEVRNGPKKKGVGIELLEVLPAIQGAALPGNFVGDDPRVYQAAGGFVTGRDDECGFVYDVAAETKICLAIPGMSDPQVFPSDINSTGRIVGTAQTLDTNEPRAFVIDLPSLDATIVPIPDGWKELFLDHVNEAGQVGGTLVRDSESSVFTEEFAFVRYPADLSSHTASSVDGVRGAYPGGLSDDGWMVGRGESGGVVWDGEPGSLVTPLQEGAFNGVAAHGIRSDGAIYGATRSSNRHHVLVWPDRFGPPSELGDLSIRRPFHDNSNHVLGVAEIERDTFEGLCAGALGSARRLAPLTGWSLAVPRTGDAGVLYGWSTNDHQGRELTSWRIPSGC